MEGLVVNHGQTYLREGGFEDLDVGLLRRKIVGRDERRLRELIDYRVGEVVAGGRLNERIENSPTHRYVLKERVRDLDLAPESVDRVKTYNGVVVGEHVREG